MYIRVHEVDRQTIGNVAQTVTQATEGKWGQTKHSINIKDILMQMDRQADRQTNLGGILAWVSKTVT
jgi:hypothetical protein